MGGQAGLRLSGEQACSWRVAGQGSCQGGGALSLHRSLWTTLQKGLTPGWGGFAGSRSQEGTFLRFSACVPETKICQAASWACAPE